MESNNLNILKLIHDGFSYDQISQKLDISIRSIFDCVGVIVEEYHEYCLMTDQTIYQISSEESDDLEIMYEQDQDETDFEFSDFPEIPVDVEPTYEDIMEYVTMANSENENGIENFASEEDGQFDDDDDDDDDGWNIDYGDYGMPCDEDAAACGVTCFNCSRGN